MSRTAAPIVIESVNDPRIAPFRELRDRPLRADGRFVAEGPFLLDRMVGAGLAIESVLIKPSRADDLAARLKPVPVYAAERPLLQEIAGYKFHRGVLTCARRPRDPTCKELIQRLSPAIHDPARAAGPGGLLIAPRVLDHENVGGLARVAAAFGLAGMLIGKESCDPYWRRAIRVSAGAVFSLPIRRSQNMADELAALRCAVGLRVYAAVLDPAARPLDQVRHAAHRPFALMVGAEDHGLSPAEIALADETVTLPMPQAVDSHNIAVAAAVCLYALQHQRV